MHRVAVYLHCVAVRCSVIQCVALTSSSPVCFVLIGIILRCATWTHIHTHTNKCFFYIHDALFSQIMPFKYIYIRTCRYTQKHIIIFQLEIHFSGISLSHKGYSAHEQDLPLRVKWATSTNEILSRMRPFSVGPLYVNRTFWKFSLPTQFVQQDRRIVTNIHTHTYVHTHTYNSFSVMKNYTQFEQLRPACRRLSFWSGLEH